MLPQVGRRLPQPRPHPANITADEPILALNLSVSELPCFYLRFQNRNQLETWRRSLLDLHTGDTFSRNGDYDVDNSAVEEEDYRASHVKRQA
jgi:hypothetical protein